MKIKVLFPRFFPSFMKANLIAGLCLLSSVVVGASIEPLFADDYEDPLVAFSDPSSVMHNSGSSQADSNVSCPLDDPCAQHKKFGPVEQDQNTGGVYVDTEKPIKLKPSKKKRSQDQLEKHARSDAAKLCEEAAAKFCNDKKEVCNSGSEQSHCLKSMGGTPVIIYENPDASGRPKGGTTCSFKLKCTRTIFEQNPSFTMCKCPGC